MSSYMQGLHECSLLSFLSFYRQGMESGPHFNTSVLEVRRL